MDDLSLVRIFWISSTEKECGIELEPELLPLVLLFPLVSAAMPGFTGMTFPIAAAPPFVVAVVVPSRDPPPPLTFFKLALTIRTELSSSVSDSLKL